jgi:hypothetical protein
MLTLQNAIKKLALLSILVITSSSTLVTLAVGNGSISISPSNSSFNPSEPLTKGWFVEKMNPSDQIKRKVLITNSTQDEKNVLISEEDYYPGDQGAYSYSDKETLKSVGTWFKLEKNELTLPAKNSAEVDFTITVPKDTKPGEYSGVIALQEVTKTATTGAISFVSRVSTRVYITVPGDLQSGVKFNNFKFVTPDSKYTDEKKYAEFLTANYNLAPDNIFVALNFANIGNVFNKIRGNIDITNPDGQTTKYSFNRDLGYGGGDIDVPYLMTDSKWTKPGKYTAKYSFSNDPLISSNKESVKNTSSSQLVETEFNITQEQIDKLKTDLAASKEKINKPSDTQVQKKDLFEVKENTNKKDDNKEESKSSSNNNAGYIAGGLVIVILLGIIAYFVIKDRSKSEKK